MLILAGGLMVGTIIGFLLVITTGLFGFKLTVITSWADLALAAEAAAIVSLTLTGVLAWRESS